MELPDISAWNAGMQHDEDSFNALSYAFNFLLGPPECKVTQTSAQSIANALSNATPITFDTMATDNDGMWDGAHPTYITIQTPGWYEIEWAVSWATKSSDTTIRIHPLYLNEDYVLGNGYAYTEYLNSSGTTPQIWNNYDMFLNTGDKLAVGVVQSSGASLSTASSGSLKDQQTFLHVRWASL